MTFNPEKHLIELQGKAYLEVKWRLVWFRSECPNGTIDTEEVLVDLDREVEAEVPTGNWIPNPNRPGKKMPEKIVKRDRGYARFRAVVTDGKGGRATATKSENAASFPDFIEKAETGAVGRALAMLGYGTAFTADELSEEHRIVDAPVERSASYQYAGSSVQTGAGASNGTGKANTPPASAVGATPPTGAQGGYLKASEIEDLKQSYGVAAGLTGKDLDGGWSTFLKQQFHGAVTTERIPVGTDEAIRMLLRDMQQSATPASEQQIASLRKLYQHLGKPEPEEMQQGTLSYAKAKEFILTASREYNESRQSRKAS